MEQGVFMSIYLALCLHLIFGSRYLLLFHVDLVLVCVKYLYDGSKHQEDISNVKLGKYDGSCAGNCTRFLSA